MNPNNDTDDVQSWLRNHALALESAKVVTVKEHVDGDDINHEIEVQSAYMDEPQFADVRVGLVGDVAIPEEGDTVLVAYRLNGKPTVIGTRYSKNDSLPSFEEGERIIGHPVSDAYIRLNTDGEILIEGDQGNTVRISSDGTVVINGGTENPVTSISTTTDADDHVTDVSTTKSTDVFVP